MNNKGSSIYSTVPASAAGAPTVASLRSAAVLLRDLGASAALLSVSDLQAFWLGIMADRRVSARERLAASRLYADSIGAFGAAAAASSTSGAVRWLEAEVVAPDAAPGEAGV